MVLVRVAALLLACVATPLGAQRTLLPADSALVGRILLAEDQRDSTSTAFAEGARSSDARIQLLARRALARIRDPRFAARDSFPTPAAAPVYPEPAWRLRYRAVVPNRTNCGAMRAALADSMWHVRLRAADSVNSVCTADTVIMRTLRQWVASPAQNSAREKGGVSWHAAAHALVALARISPADAKNAIPSLMQHPSPFMRVYIAHAARLLSDDETLRRLVQDRDDNVKEAAIDGLSRVTGHADDGFYIAALSARGYQAVRAAARALKGTPRRGEAAVAAVAVANRLRRDQSETSRDARRALVDLIADVQPDPSTLAPLVRDFDCVIARAMAAAVDSIRRGGPPILTQCEPLPITLPPDAVRLALGDQVRLRVTMADFSGGGEFTVRLRGDVAPIMAARVLAMVKGGYYNGLSWHRVEPDFVVQGGGKGANEYVGYPRFFRDELATLSHSRGTVGMSTRGHDTGDGQWFFNLRDNARLTRDYTVFAEVTDGIEVVDGILEGDVIARIEVIRPG